MRSAFLFENRLENANKIKIQRCLKRKHKIKVKLSGKSFGVSKNINIFATCLRYRHLIIQQFKNIEL